MSNVRIWEEKIMIPTYPAAKPEKNPLFIEKRAYQGSTGKVYPLPVTEKIADEKTDVEYNAVFIENEYLQVMVLPELGGRIQRAYDKTNGYDFVYYNHVIKPALVGLAGPWISGGIEFNWPQHHRPSTFSPVDHCIKNNEDGSATVHISEIDKMYGTKGMASITLYPGKAYIEIKGQMYNPTDLPQTFLWWSNPAVPVNDHTYSVFPPDVNAVFDHGKRAVATFPIATGEYYKYDYSEGIDISRYKNIKVPTSYMAASSSYDFVGNYDEEKQAGLLHVADHHVSPGKKQWTWGGGDFGQAWDRNLTEEDGPYIELMTGQFADNQPDFTWLKPGEEKTFTQYFMPYKSVGRVGNATKDACVSVIAKSEGAELNVYATGVYEAARIFVREGGQLLYRNLVNLSPEKAFTAQIPAPAKWEDLTIEVMSAEGKDLVVYKYYKPELKEIPEAAEPMKKPVDMKSNEELYLAGQHLEQYRHATYEPADYYLEGLRRDPSDIRINNAYGLLLYRRGHVEESIAYFKRAIEKQTWKNPNPYMGECYYNYGLALAMTGKDEKAFDAFYKATWSAETQNGGFYWLAVLSTRKGAYEEALAFAEKSLIRNWHDMRTRNLKAALLRKLGREYYPYVQESLEIDPMYQGLLYEQGLANDDLDRWVQNMRGEAHNYLELAIDYSLAGLYEDALTILALCPQSSPMPDYYQGWLLAQLGLKEEAAEAFADAEAKSPDYCFPNRVEEIQILQCAIDTLGQAPMAHYYLGNLLYDKKQYDAAIEHWETAVSEKPDLAVCWRNLSIAYYNKKNDTAKAMEVMVKACRLNPEYPRLWLEYDQLAAKRNVSVEERIGVMESHPEITAARDDLYLRYIQLLNLTGRHKEAYDRIMGRQFHPWEGGEGKVSTQYKQALIGLAKQAMEEGEAQKAIELLQETLTYPHNLGEGKLFNVPDNEAWYYMGLANLQLGKKDAAEACFRQATVGSQEPEPVLYYNDQPSDYIYYQGLAFRELGEEAKALKSFHQLVIYGEKHLFDKVEYDFFAVSLPEIEVYQDDIYLRNEQYCNYLRMLGAKGLGEEEKADKLRQEILSKQCDYQFA